MTDRLYLSFDCTERSWKQSCGEGRLGYFALSRCHLSWDRNTGHKNRWMDGRSAAEGDGNARSLAINQNAEQIRILMIVQGESSGNHE